MSYEKMNIYFKFILINTLAFSFLSPVCHLAKKFVT